MTLEKDRILCHNKGVERCIQAAFCWAAEWERQG